MATLDGAFRTRLPERSQAGLIESIGRSIVTGTLPPGSTISPDAIADEAGVSKPLLREVFKVLEGLGLITARPKVGTRVTEPVAWNYLDGRVIQWRLQSSEARAQVSELYAMRLGVEPVAARLVAMRGADESRLAELDSSVAEMAAAWESRDVHTFAEADTRFHATLLELSGNKMFACLTDVIASAVRLRETLVFPLESEVLSGLDEHRLLIAQLRAGDPGAEDTSRSIIRGADLEAEKYLS